MAEYSVGADLGGGSIMYGAGEFCVEALLSAEDLARGVLVGSGKQQIHEGLQFPQIGASNSSWNGYTVKAQIHKLEQNV